MYFKGFELHTRLFLVVVMLITSSLSACGKETPDCASAESKELIRSICINKTRERIWYSDDPDKIINKYLALATFNLTTITNEGYDNQTSKQLCGGQLSVSTPDGKTSNSRISYSMQRALDNNHIIVIGIEGANLIIEELVSSASKYYLENRWAGNWLGTYSCGGLYNYTSGPQGPFNMPVRLLVEKGEEQAAFLERVTKSGGYEKLSGNMQYGHLILNGEGANTPEDRWFTTFKGDANGRKLTAQGRISIAQDQKLRDCTLELNQQAK